MSSTSAHQGLRTSRTYVVVCREDRMLSVISAHHVSTLGHVLTKLVGYLFNLS